MTYASVPTPSARGRGVELTTISADTPMMRARGPSALLVVTGASETFFMTSTEKELAQRRQNHRISILMWRIVLIWFTLISLTEN
jgi:hypothetical protein